MAETERARVDEILTSVWNAAVDASNSRDFHDEDGDLNEDAYLRYQRNTFDRAANELDALR